MGENETRCPRPAFRGQRSSAKYAKRLSLSCVIGYLLATIPGYPYASQDLSASGGLRPLSGINWAWLDKLEWTSPWGRNPFGFPRTSPNGDSEAPDDEGALQLSAILYHKEGSVAIINHRIVRPGDSIGGKTVVSILENRVVLKDLNGIFELKLNAFGAK